MPYRIDLRASTDEAFDRLVQLGALDVEPIEGGLAAIMPDMVAPATVAAALGAPDAVVSAAVGRDDGSVWVLSSRPVRAGRLQFVPASAPATIGALRPAIVPADGSVQVSVAGPLQIVLASAAADNTMRIVSASVPTASALAGVADDTSTVVAASVAADGTLRMIDGPAFGTGLHPTTALCLEAIAAEVGTAPPTRALDVGTGSGILALAALALGVRRVIGVDIDPEALHVAAANGRLNGLASRLSLVCSGVDAISGSWPLVLANVLAAPLMDMAPALTRRVGSGGRLVLSGIPASVADDVARVYRHLGMRPLRSETRSGWAVLVLQSTW